MKNKTPSIHASITYTTKASSLPLYRIFIIKTKALTIRYVLNNDTIAICSL